MGNMAEDIYEAILAREQLIAELRLQLRKKESADDPPSSSPSASPK